jgi:hypothetical protein
MLARLVAAVGMIAFASGLAGPLEAQGQGKVTTKAAPSRDATVTGTVVHVSCTLSGKVSEAGGANAIQIASIKKA